MIAGLKAYAWQALALLLAALLAWQAIARLGAERDVAQVRAELAGEREVAATAALQASEKYRKLEDKHRDDLRNIDSQARQDLSRSAADADAARAAAGRLRGDLTDYITAHRAAANARATAGQCAPDAGALDLLAELQRRADERAGELARIADDARSRGGTCERTYDAGREMTQAAQ
ncbi:uncharacterized protein DUF2514 [Delftia acidovorans]|uniref:DUF2514 family protein n=1 Tax=Delftia acidovorans TaxID=80866 RepID=UPI000F9D8998|nr:DUF2514 family protein [Delftia acidovorans]ROQ90103.1 uncharacterized protein DUF2514 [Delftia acidovorans]